MTGIIYDKGMTELDEGGSIDYVNDTIKLMLVSSNYFPDGETHQNLADLTEEISGSGYTAGGKVLNNKNVIGSDPAYYFADGLTWPLLSAINVRYAVIYKDNGTPETSWLIACVDLGKDYDLVGQDLTIEFNMRAIFSISKTLGKENLISWWSLDETSGTRADSHGNNHLTDNNTVGYGVGVKGNAAEFKRNNNEYLSCQSTEFNFGNSSFSFGIWIKAESLPVGSWMGIFTRNPSPTQFGLTYQQAVDSIIFYVSGDGINTKSVHANGLTIGTWYFVVCVHDADDDEIKIYKNSSTPINTTAFSAGIYENSNILRVGMGNGLYFDGVLDEGFVFGKALSNDEINWLYNNGNGRQYTDLGSLTNSIYSPSISLYDTRVRLRARKRRVLLATNGRNIQ